MCVCVLLFSRGTPAGRSNEAQLRFAVQKAEVALQYTHELLRAICGRWHSPLFPHPRRHQQMVNEKTLNIKQPPFIFSPRSAFSYKTILVLFWYFCFTLDPYKNRKWPPECFKAFPQCWVFLDICFLCCFPFFRKRERWFIVLVLFVVAILNDIISCLAVLSWRDTCLFAWEGFGQQGRLRSQTISIHFCYLLKFSDCAFSNIFKISSILHFTPSNLTLSFLCLYPTYLIY